MIDFELFRSYIDKRWEQQTNKARSIFSELKNKVLQSDGYMLPAMILQKVLDSTKENQITETLFFDALHNLPNIALGEVDPDTLRMQPFAPLSAAAAGYEAGFFVATEAGADKNGRASDVFLIPRQGKLVDVLLPSTVSDLPRKTAYAGLAIQCKTLNTTSANRLRKTFNDAAKQLAQSSGGIILIDYTVALIKHLNVLELRDPKKIHEAVVTHQQHLVRECEKHLLCEHNHRSRNVAGIEFTALCILPDYLGYSGFYPSWMCWNQNFMNRHIPIDYMNTDNFGELWDDFHRSRVSILQP